MKTFFIMAAKTVAYFLLIAASIVLILIAYCTYTTDPWIWLASTLGSVVCFMLALGITLGIFGEEKEAPKAQTRSEYESENANLKTA